ncbi:MAG: aminodeoxychorismate lyase [Gammaproteobacteria bacterium]|nr:aminodeoxychorismate lyase [Gammaproteobacteria bacterium]MCP5137172.1 aminodeoxychorismate lyase [Gammaproteobacteria bacterium]
MILIDGVQASAVAVTDRGLQYGDGVFETCAVRDRRIEYWPEHVARLQAGCERLGFPAPHADLLRAEAERVLEDVEGRAVLKIIVTRGSGGRGYRPPRMPEPRRILSVYPFPEYPPRFATQGVVLHACRTAAVEHPALVGIKHLNRLPQVLARAEWDHPGIPEGLMCDTDGRPVEGTQSNLFVVQDGVLHTPDLSRVGVAGIIRARVLAMAGDLGLPYRIENLPPNVLDRVDEVFVCNSVIGIWPVIALESRRWPVGPLTRQLQTALEAERSCRVG